MRKDTLPEAPRAVTADNARILEIGTHATMKSAFPERTTLLSTYHRLLKPLEFYQPFSLRSAWQAWRRIRRGEIDLIVVAVPAYAPWNFRQLKAILGPPFNPLGSLVRIWGIQALRVVATTTPIVAIDNEDSRTIASHNLFLLDKARLFFKRELPVDRWQVFQHTAHAGIPGYRFRMKPRNRRRVEKLRPLSLGVTPSWQVPAQMNFPTKTADVFAALTLEGGTTVRNEGIVQLRALKAQGVAVDIAKDRLAPADYAARMSRAWLTWSPEGLGWECFRHYEAPLMCSVPVINTPTIARYRPLVAGVHAVYYSPDEPGGLANAIKAALADKARLRAMAETARAHVLAHHVRPRPLADAILRMGLGLEEAPGGVSLAE
jgi:hypothetical protein